MRRYNNSFDQDLHFIAIETEKGFIHQHQSWVFKSKNILQVIYNNALVSIKFQDKDITVFKEITINTSNFNTALTISEFAAKLHPVNIVGKGVLTGSIDLFGI